MLHYAAYKHLKEEHTGDCTCIVVYDESNTPIAFVAPMGESYIASTVTDKDFDTWMLNLGIDKLKINDSVDPIFGNS